MNKEMDHSTECINGYQYQSTLELGEIRSSQNTNASRWLGFIESTITSLLYIDTHPIALIKLFMDHEITLLS